VLFVARLLAPEAKNTKEIKQKLTKRQSRNHNIDAGATPRYWFRAEDAEERRGSKNLNPTLRYSATSARETFVALREIGCQQCKDRKEEKLFEIGLFIYGQLAAQRQRSTESIRVR
jgi:hypothetical protein